MLMRHRVFKIRNDNAINPISHKPVAYKLQALASQMMLMNPRSFNQTRAKCATKLIWVTKYGELYAAGESINQSKKSAGVEEWTARKDNVEDNDLGLRHLFSALVASVVKTPYTSQLGTSMLIQTTCKIHSIRSHPYNPRPEAFPIMPVERISTSCLKPDVFFQKNPALDVPASNQSFSNSQLHEGGKPDADALVPSACHCPSKTEQL
ncbi:hypothetical protein PABG_11201 [Paracoccidioides brasiliensis Pb03]|nr:hypothetical protein PABG_11201 [Paracoccidioides brasiliensis Pb03]